MKNILKIGERMMRTAVVVTAICCSIVGLAVAEDIRAAVRKPIDIPPQPLGSALKALASERGFQILFLSSVVGDARTEGARGDLTPAEALGQLLAGTGLSFKYLDESTVTIAGPGSAPAAPKKTSQVEEVVVVGSRLARPTEEGPAPVTVFNRDKIDALGVTTISDVLKYLPQQSFNTRNTQYVGGSQTVQLRGLAVGTTLVLLNGLRAVPGAGAISAGFFDLNSIPLAAVERIEILADSASAVYGADAVGGVVNIVLKSSVAQPVIDLSYGSADGGADERRASLSFGGRSERAHGLVILDYLKRGELLGTERDIVANADYRRFGGLDTRTVVANPGNICAASGNLPGLSTPCAAVPAGSTGVGLTPASFLATAGLQNLDSASASSSYITPAENYGAMASGTFDISEQVTVFGELMYTDRTNERIDAYSSVSNALVPATNPFNPFGVPVRASFRLTDRNPIDINKQKSYREVLGVRGKLQTWDWDVSFTGSQSESIYNGTYRLNSARLNAALAATSPDSALNVFVDGPGGSEALLASLRGPDTYERSTADTSQIGGQVRGELFDVPAGPVQIVIGGEWRKENTMNAPTLAGRTAYSGYAESKVPLLGDSTGIPLVHDVALIVAGRYDHYSDFGGTFNGQYGVEWRPVATLLVRGSYGESFRAPSLFRLYQPSTAFQNIAIPDPWRNETAQVTYIVGGNPALMPETSTSSSFGAVWEPDVAGHPKFVASFWRIEQSDRLSSFSHLELLANEPYLPAGLLIRAQPTPEDVAAGRPGTLQSVDIRNVNLGSLSTSGVDLEAGAFFQTPWGHFTPRVAATRMSKYDVQDFPFTPTVDRVGMANTSGSMPKWKAVGSLGWDRNGIAVTGTARYSPSYTDMTGANVPNGLTVASRTLFDLQVALNLDEAFGGASGAGKGLTVRAGGTNLFDEEPPYSGAFTSGYDQTQGDIRQRFLYLAVSKRF